MSELLFGAIELTKGLREALPFFEHIIEQSPLASATHVIELARDAGLSFRDSGAFNIISQLKSNASLKAAFKLTSFDSLPDPNTLGIAITPLRKDYSYLVSIKGLNEVTGARERRFVTIVSDDLLSPAQIFKAAMGLPTGQEGSQLLRNQTVTLESALKSPLAD